MTLKYNPQLKIELVKLTPEGDEEPIDVQIIPADLSHHSGNKPPRCQVNIQKALGSVQQQCTITLHNAPIIEEIRRDFAAFIPKIRDEFWRVKVWAWWANSPDKTEPDSSPVFVGDISDDFQVQSSGTNDSSLTLTAHGHNYLMRSGKYRKTYPPETSYREIVDDIFAYFVDEKKYGPKVVIQDFNGVLEKEKLTRSESVNQNPVEELNNICGDLDFVWGVDAKTLYMLKRDEYFLNDLTVDYNKITAAIIYKSGTTSLLGFGKYTFGFETLFDTELSLGKLVAISEYPQFGVPFGNIYGRVNELSYQLDNYSGHKMSVSCQFSLGDDFVDLPPRKDDSSGQRH